MSSTVKVWNASKRLPLWGSWLAEGQTEEVPWHYSPRLFRDRTHDVPFLLEQRREAIHKDLFRLAASRQSTFPKGEG